MLGYNLYVLFQPPHPQASCEDDQLFRHSTTHVVYVSSCCGAQKNWHPQSSSWQTFWLLTLMLVAPGSLCGTLNFLFLRSRSPVLCQNIVIGCSHPHSLGTPCPTWSLCWSWVFPFHLEISVDHHCHWVPPCIPLTNGCTRHSSNPLWNRRG